MSSKLSPLPGPVSHPVPATALAEHTAEIRRLGKQAVENVVAIGCHLIECKKLLGHGNWLPWLKWEFGWTDRTALNFMRVAELSKSETVSDLRLPVKALYLLAAPSTPAAAKTEIIARAQAGEQVSAAEVKRVIKDTKSKQPAKRTRNFARANIYRRMKLGDDTVDALKETSLDNAREQDALIFLNRGAPEGEHTPIVKCLIADAEAGKAVSALQFKNGSIQACDLKVAHEQDKDDLAEQLQAAKIKIAGLESEIADLKAAAKSAPASKSGSRCSICHETKPATLRPAFICDECVHVFDVREAMPTPDDGLDIPAPLRREEMPS
jgi:hypothetical protein